VTAFSNSGSNDSNDHRHNPDTPDVVNAGVGGNNTADLLQRIDADCLSHHPDLTVLMVGTNDMNSQKYIPLNTYRKNLNDLITRITTSGSQLLLMTILPPYEPYLLTRHPSSFYQPEGVEGRRRQYNDTIRSFAQEKQLPLLDMGQRFTSVGNIGTEPDSLLKNDANSGQKDGVHPTPNGYRFIALSVYDHIRCLRLPQKRIVCFGDSITRGDKDSYPGYLAKLLATVCIFFLTLSLATGQTRSPEPTGQTKSPAPTTQIRSSTHTYRSRITDLYNIINDHLRDSATGLYYETDSTVNENTHSWLWPLCAYIQAANEMESLDPAGTYLQPVVQAIERYYSPHAPPPARKGKAAASMTTTNGSPSPSSTPTTAPARKNTCAKQK